MQGNKFIQILIINNFFYYLKSSGSGKTTLLNTLNFRTPRNFHVTGNIKINGKEVNADEVGSYIGFVPQDDLFIGTLTVFEHLKFMV